MSRQRSTREYTAPCCGATLRACPGCRRRLRSLDEWPQRCSDHGEAFGDPKPTRWTGKHEAGCGFCPLATKDGWVEIELVEEALAKVAS